MDVDPGHFQTRRATLEDLPSLVALWEVNQLSASELERHLTEFQLAFRSDGVLVAGIGFRALHTQGLLHSEAAYSPRHIDEARPALWERIKNLARNQGMARVWFRGSPAEYWRGVGFREARDDELDRLPPGFGAGRDTWWVYAFWDEAQVQRQLAERIESFHETEQANNERFRRQALVFKWIAGLIAFGFLVGAVILLVRIVSHYARLRR